MKYLLAAEADRIQDLLFRSSKLREVAGGSLLLSRFCEAMPDLLAKQLDIGDMKVITHGGGSFYLTFEIKDNAWRFGPALAEAYARTLGGTLSYAEPAEFADDAGYANASKTAGKNLRQAKRSGAAVAMEQMPYIAFCESCGVGLAEAHEIRFEAEEGHYYCHACRTKAAEYRDNKRGFLQAFTRDIRVDEATFVNPDWQEGKDAEGIRMQWDKIIAQEELKLPDEPEKVAIYDARNYVAYIVADGNGMGKVFSQCNAAQAQALSQFMDIALRRALAKAIRAFRENQAYKRKEDGRVPALPLIMGGDDLFALVPAPFALDIAGRMCAEFQTMMTDFVCEKGIKDENGKPLPITMSAAVVICKANYPYNLAHDLGEDRLSETKRAVKALAAKEGLSLSAVDFEVVLGSQIEHKSTKDEPRATLRPYWITDQPLPAGWGLSLTTLLDARLKLAQTLASRRRSQLRALFDDLSDKKAWKSNITELLDRIEPDRKRELEPNDHDNRLKFFPLTTMLEDLGGIEIEKWMKINRLFDDKTWYGHGMGDLLRFWDWTLDLNHGPAEYEGGAS
ncbi:MAG TPA: hypothetical protein PKV20_02540 [Anaerolineae bacterium]|nr:hypothetical protein [Anaerolineae bacterium]